EGNRQRVAGGGGARNVARPLAPLVKERAVAARLDGEGGALPSGHALIARLGEDLDVIDAQRGRRAGLAPEPVMDRRREARLIVAYVESRRGVGRVVGARNGGAVARPGPAEAVAARRRRERRSASDQQGDVLGRRRDRRRASAAGAQYEEPALH